MARLRSNFLRGLLTTAAGSGDLTLTSTGATGFSTLPVVAGGDTVALVLDPEGVFGNPEIVTVTAHSSSATSVTVSRAAESTTARSHGVGTVWRFVPTKADWDKTSQKPVAADKTYFVSTSGSDTSDGLSWGTAMLTIAAAISAGAKKIQLGAGDFSFSTALAPTTGTTIQGVGSDINGNSEGTRLIYTGSAYAIAAATGAYRVTFRDLQIKCTTAGAGGVNLPNTTYYWTFENVELYGPSTTEGTGLYLHGQSTCCCLHNFKNMNVANFGTCIKLSGFANAGYFEQVHLGSTNQAIDISKDNVAPWNGTDTIGGADNLFIRCEINGATVAGINIGSGGARNTFIKVVEDGVTTTALVDNGAGYSSYIACVFQSGKTFTDGVGAAPNNYIDCVNAATNYENRFQNLYVVNALTAATSVMTPILQAVAGNLVLKDNAGAAGVTVRTTDVFCDKTVLFNSHATLLDGMVLRLGTAGTRTLRFGTGSPEGAVTAGIGSLFLRSDGGAGTTLYIKESGTGNTGWVAK